jgi:hypothetical protein
MGMLVWIMMGLALWHFTVWFPDRYWGGIVGALVGAVVGAVAVAIAINLAVHGYAVPGRHDTDLATSLDAIPGALIGIGAMYYEGVRRGYQALDL